MQGSECPGFIPLIYAYLDILEVGEKVRATVSGYLRFIQARVNGTLLTAAQWMRACVIEHPEYKHDSVVSEAIAYDLVRECDRVGTGEAVPPRLLGAYVEGMSSPSPLAECAPPTPPDACHLLSRRACVTRARVCV